jgi:hypothetical protein
MQYLLAQKYNIQENLACVLAGNNVSDPDANWIGPTVPNSKTGSGPAKSRTKDEQMKKFRTNYRQQKLFFKSRSYRKLEGPTSKNIMQSFQTEMGLFEEKVQYIQYVEAKCKQPYTMSRKSIYIHQYRNRWK